MPELSRFFGIVITMYARDHQPPHFHARYNDREALIEIASSRVLYGSLPRRAQQMVQEWYELRQPEIQAAWDALRAGRTPDRIAPLD